MHTISFQELKPSKTGPNGQSHRFCKNSFFVKFDNSLKMHSNPLYLYIKICNSESIGTIKKKSCEVTKKARNFKMKNNILNEKKISFWVTADLKNTINFP